MKTIKNNFSKSTKISLLLLVMSIAVNNLLKAQVAINEDDSNGNASAALDVKSTTKGVLFPVMTNAERLALKSPATGLIIFNRSTAYFNYYDGTNWIQIARTVVVGATNPVGAGTDVGVGVGVADPDNSAILHVNSVTKGFLLPRNTTNPSSPATGLIYYKSSATSNHIFFYNSTSWEQISSSTTLGAAAGGAETAAGLLIGTGTIAASAKMEVSSSTGGLLIPRMTDAERDAINSPAEGLLIYNTTSNTIQYFASATWYKWTSGVSNYGQVVGNPGTSCKDIYNNNAATNGVDGTYYINPNGTTYACHCDMTRDGGGWTLVVNTGPKGTVNTGTAASGSYTPVSTSNSGAFAKLSDTEINAIRGGASGYATSCLKVERQNSCATNKSIYFNENVAFNSAATAGNSINTYYTTYANYLASSSLQTATNSYASAFDSWTGGTAGYQIIYSYNAEGFITNGCNSTTSCTTSNRSECSVLVWIK